MVVPFQSNPFIPSPCIAILGSWWLENKNTSNNDWHEPPRQEFLLDNKAAHQISWSERVRHEDISSLAVLVSVMGKSTSEGVPESIGEETVKFVISGWLDSVTESVVEA